MDVSSYRGLDTVTEFGFKARLECGSMCAGFCDKAPIVLDQDLQCSGSTARLGRVRF